MGKAVWGLKGEGMSRGMTRIEWREGRGGDAM